jgi:hypothetical protein
MNIVTMFLDFWLSDFKWYRSLTENKKIEWLCQHRKTLHGIESSNWERHPKGTFLMIQLVKKINEEQPNFKSLDQATQRKLAQKYINEGYGTN